MTFNEQDQYHELFERSKHELVLQVMEAENCITANDELMQLLEQVITLQDKMITNLYKDFQQSEGRASGLKKLVPIYNDEDKLNILRDKISKFGKQLPIGT